MPVRGSGRDVHMASVLLGCQRVRHGPLCQIVTSARADHSHYAASSMMPCFFLPDDSLSSPVSLSKSALATTKFGSSILTSFSRAPPPATSHLISPFDLPNSSLKKRST